MTTNSVAVMPRRFAVILAGICLVAVTAGAAAGTPAGGKVVWTVAGRAPGRPPTLSSDARQVLKTGAGGLLVLPYGVVNQKYDIAIYAKQGGRELTTIRCSVPQKFNDCGKAAPEFQISAAGGAYARIVVVSNQGLGPRTPKTYRFRLVAGSGAGPYVVQTFVLAIKRAS